MNELAPPKFGMGASVLRVEDDRFIQGHGTYTTDIQPDGALHGYMVRSPIAHARVTVGGLEDARAAPGVELILTADDVADLGTIPCLAPIPIKGGGEMDLPYYPTLCGDVVRHVGDGILFIVADSVANARSAADLIEIDYEPLPVSVEAEDALADDAPLVWPDRGSNLGFEFERGDEAATEAAIASAATIVRQRIVNNRLVCNYMEPRAIVVDYDGEAEKWTVHVGSQGVHGKRDALAKVMNVEPDQIHVLTTDVGGGFGTKAFVYREYPLCMIAAKRLGKAVRWVSDRNEHFISCAQGRDNVADATLAFDADGKITAFRVDLIANMGAYYSMFAPFIPYLGTSMTTGVYDIQTIYVLGKGVFTHTLPVDAYRGAGRPEAAYLIERLMDEAGRVTGLGPVEIRRRNFIRPDQMPYKTPTDRTYDTGEFDGQMSRALEVSDYDSFQDRMDESGARGRIRGIGFATYIEACAFPGGEPAKLSLEGDGLVVLDIGTQSNGQGHETAYAQFVAGPLGLDYDKIKVVQGDSERLATGGGTGGSRSIPLGVPSVDRASNMLADQLKALAADELEAAAADIELVGGSARIAGTDRAIGFADLAAKANDPAKLTAIGEYKQEEATYPNGTHVCELEIDPETGVTDILRYTIVDDFGVTVNPILLAGQVHGGAAQGIGQALLELTAYDGEGQLLTATFNDYTMPRSVDIPDFHFETRNVPSTWNAMGIKGAGEAGSIGSTPAVMNAVVDALNRAYGIRNMDMPATSNRVWEAIQAVKS